MSRRAVAEAMRLIVPAVLHGRAPLRGRAARDSRTLRIRSHAPGSPRSACWSQWCPELSRRSPRSPRRPGSAREVNRGSARSWREAPQHRRSPSCVPTRSGCQPQPQGIKSALICWNGVALEAIGIVQNHADGASLVFTAISEIRVLVGQIAPARRHRSLCPRP